MEKEYEVTALGLLVTAKQELGLSSVGIHLTITIDPVAVNPDRCLIRNCTDCWSTPPPWRVLENFHLRATCWDDMSDRKPSSWEYGFSQAYFVGEARAEAMFKLLRKTRLSLEKQEATNGSVESFGAWVLRVGKALGAKHIITEHPDYWDHPWQGSTTYDRQEERWIWGDLKLGMDRINHRARHWAQKRAEYTAVR
jgi:hypothetical protein